MLIACLDQQSSWSELTSESLPAAGRNTGVLHAARSWDNLSASTVTAASDTSSTRDPFDTSPFWTNTSQNASAARPNYDIQINESSLNSLDESRHYSSKNYSDQNPPVYNNILDVTPAVPSTSSQRNLSYNSSNSTTNINSNIDAFKEMSLDDRISTSLNLKSKNVNSDNIYANHNVYNGADAAAGTSTATRSAYGEMPVYGNFEINPTQSQFILETKDYYTKYSTTPSAVVKSDYERNIYVPKREEESEKLRDFSEGVENSKNYSSVKYQYSYVGDDYGTTESRVYDEVNDTASNLYSEITESRDAVYTNARLYDEVYEPAAPRPHRPAPPCPSKHN